MLVNSLLLHLLLGFVVGGSWIALITWLGELRGSRFGGFIAGLPSTVAVSFLFIGWNQSAEAAVEATTTFPLFYSFAGIFLLSFAALAGRWERFWRSIFVSLVVWFILTTLVAASGVRSFGLCLIACILVSFAVYLLFAKKVISSRTVSDKRGSRQEIAIRFLFGGGIVSLAVLTSKLAGPHVGVIPTSFPAISCSTLYVLNRIHGLEFTRAFAMPIMLTAMVTTVPYVVAVRMFYPIAGIWIGTLASYFVAIPFAVIAFLVLNPEIKILSKVAWQ